MLCLDRENALKLNYTGEKESYNWSSFKSTFLNHVLQNVVNMICWENWLYKHHLQKVMQTYNNPKMEFNLSTHQQSTQLDLHEQPLFTANKWHELITMILYSFSAC